MKNELLELFKDTYNRTVEDNKEDFIRTYSMLSKLCTFLAFKNILKEEEVSQILDFYTNIEDLKFAEERSEK